MFFGIMSGESSVLLLLAVTMFLTWPDVPWDAIQWGGAAGVVLLAPLLIPFSRVVWLAVDVLVRPVVPEELVDSADSLRTSNAAGPKSMT